MDKETLNQANMINHRIDTVNNVLLAMNKSPLTIQSGIGRLVEFNLASESIRLPNSKPTVPEPIHRLDDEVRSAIKNVLTTYVQELTELFGRLGEE